MLELQLPKGGRAMEVGSLSDRVRTVLVVVVPNQKYGVPISVVRT